MPLSRISSPSIQNFSVEAQDFANNSVETYTSNTGRPLSNRNLVINGAMQVAQRATSVTGITTDGYYTADRWRISLSSAGTWTSNVDSSGPANTEFRNSANVVCTTADSSLAAGDFFIFNQELEGQNVQGIKKGTSAAESLTVSFYVKSSNTGTYICEFVDADNARQISKSYTIDTANTWEKKTITIPPDTTGLFDNDNALSLRLFFWLAAGTTFTSGTPNDSAWASNVNANRAVGQLNLANLSGNYWAVTGIQLETGEVATPFEMRSIGQELALCQRYYEKSYNVDVAPGTATSAGRIFAYGSTDGIGNVGHQIKFSAFKRTSPTMTYYTDGGTLGSWSFNRFSGSGTSTVTDGGTSGEGGSLAYVGTLTSAYVNININGHWVASAEL
jgi:hypothetical protein